MKIHMPTLQHVRDLKCGFIGDNVINPNNICGKPADHFGILRWESGGIKAAHHECYCKKHMNKIEGIIDWLPMTRDEFKTAVLLET
jgi:hypothetical protein